MNNMRRIFFVALVFVIALGLISCHKLNEGDEIAEPEIIEINTEESVGVGNYSDQLTISRYYMILNYDEEDLEGLYTIVESFLVDNMEAYETRLKADEDYDEHEIAFEMFFYRESKFLPRDWEPDGSFFVSDEIEDHNNDLVAYVVWSGKNKEVLYYLMQRSTKKQIYGNPIWGKKYINSTSIEILNYSEDEINIDGFLPDDDGDGLDNWSEIGLSLNPYSADTDADGVSDKEDNEQTTAYILIYDFRNSLITG